jgi:hypothetical protein
MISIIYHRDPTDISRDKLVETLEKMRKNFATKCKPHDEDDMHSVPIQDMGNYHEYLKSQAQPLRELEAQLVRQHMFGNPFKLVSKDAARNMMGGGGMFGGADEIDEILEESAENSANTGQQQQQQQQQRTGNSQQQQQLLLQQQQTRRGGMRQQRRSVKGPLSKRINYLKNLYTQNNASSGSGAVSTISDSDIEIMDDLSSIGSEVTTTTVGSGAQFSGESSDADLKNNGQIDPAAAAEDVANLNDFNDMDVEMLDQQQTQQQQQQINDANELLNDEVIEINEKADGLIPSISNEDDDINNNKSGADIGLSDALRSMSVLSGAFSSPNELLLMTAVGSASGFSALCDNYLEQSYIQLKILCMEQVKRPGKDHARLFQLIQEAPLTIRLRCFLLRELAHEAARFKRTQLVQLLNKYASLLLQLASVTLGSNGSSQPIAKAEAV